MSDEMGKKEVEWKVHIPNLLSELLNNDQASILVRLIQTYENKKMIFSFIKETNNLFITRSKSKKWVISAVLVTLLTAGYIYLLTNKAFNPLWLVYWLLIIPYSSALSEIAYRRFIVNKENELAQILDNPSGMIWTIYTSNGAKIGEIKEVDYFRAKHEADLSILKPCMQILIFIWVAWSMFVQILSLTPILLVITLFIMYQTMPEEEIISLTIGQLMTSGAIDAVFMLILGITITLPFFYLVIGQPLPGYKNFRRMRLQRALSKYVPNIANANGFSIQGVKFGASNTSLKAS